jgi:hypothetical protein
VDTITVKFGSVSNGSKAEYKIAFSNVGTSVINIPTKKAEEFERIPRGATGTFKFDGRVSSKDGRFYMDLECWQWTLDQQAAPPASSGDPF